MNKSQLIDTLADRFDGSRKEAAHALDAVLDTITRQVAKGEKVAITGFGSFEKAVRNARWVRNPQTGARMKAKKTAVPKFSAVSRSSQEGTLTFCSRIGRGSLKLFQYADLVDEALPGSDSEVLAVPLSAAARDAMHRQRDAASRRAAQYTRLARVQLVAASRRVGAKVSKFRLAIFFSSYHGA